MLPANVMGAFFYRTVLLYHHYYFFPRSLHGRPGQRKRLNSRTERSYDSAIAIGQALDSIAPSQGRALAN